MDTTGNSDSPATNTAAPLAGANRPRSVVDIRPNSYVHGDPRRGAMVRQDGPHRLRITTHMYDRLLRQGRIPRYETHTVAELAQGHAVGHLAGDLLALEQVEQHRAVSGAPPAEVSC